MLLADPGFDPTLVENALQDILCSQFFRSSAQCSSLLRYVVQNTLADRDECLRERVIGSEVFDRAPDYDTGNDHIVRSRASEVRKRLAQYYQAADALPEVRISIPSGSYRATFEKTANAALHIIRVSDSTSVAESPEHLHGDLPLPLEHSEAIGHRDEVGFSPKQEVYRPKRWHLSLPGRKMTAGIVLFAGLFAAVFLARIWSTTRNSAYLKFWSPVNKSQKPALIYCGGGFVYKLSDDFLDAYRISHGVKDPRREFFVELKPGESVPAQALVPDKHFVPFGDLASTARIVSTLATFKKPYDLRYGDDLAFTEFRTSPVILIGGLNNSWALKVTHNLRFVLDQDDRIVDQWHREKVWKQTADPENQARDDYAIISRLSSSDNGAGFVLSIAGIRMYGTRAAAELISDPVKLNQILKDLPRGWETKNLQVVLHTRTMNEIPISVNVEATYSW